MASLEEKRIEVNKAVDSPRRVLAKAELLRLAMEMVVVSTLRMVVATEPAMLNLGQFTKATTTPTKLRAWLM